MSFLNSISPETQQKCNIRSCMGQRKGMMTRDDYTWLGSLKKPCHQYNMQWLYTGNWQVLTSSLLSYWLIFCIQKLSANRRVYESRFGLAMDQKLYFCQAFLNICQNGPRYWLKYQPKYSPLIGKMFLFSWFGLGKHS